MWYLVGLGIVLGTIQGVLVVLKIEALISWPWVVVFIPLYPAVAIAIVGVLFWAVVKYGAGFE